MMARQLTLQPQLLSYRALYVLDGAIVNIDLFYSERCGAWYASLYTQDGLPILLGRRVVAGWPINPGTRDARLPVGLFFCVNTGEDESDPGVVGLGTTSQIVYVPLAELQADLAEIAPIDYLAPRLIVVNS